MNRRQAIQKAVVLGGALATVPAIVQASDGGVLGYPATCGPSVNAPEWKEPPLDLRTPEQIMEEQEENWAKDYVRQAQEDYTKYHRFHYTAPPRIFARVERMLSEQNISFEKRDVAGRLSLIINGNVISIEG